MQTSFEIYAVTDLNDRVMFSDIEVGGYFATERWCWEKLDEQNARAVDGVESNSAGLLGQVHQFHPWSVVSSVALA